MSVELIDGGVTSPAGFVAGATVAGLRSTPAPDLALIATDGAPATAVATFTTNRFPAAPVLVAKELLAAGGGRARAVVINAGCANAGTGEQGIADARAVIAAAARRVGCAPGEVLPASTGLIGSPLGVEKIEKALIGLPLSRGRAASRAAASAIMTTDTRPKEAAARVSLDDGVPLTVGGMAKGAGMIHPQMATMLAFLTTDAHADVEVLAPMLRDAVERTFNQVSIDGDGSTNDAVMLLAGGAPNAPPLTDDALGALAEGIEAVCRSLAQQIAADGEGARHRIDVVVTGAATDEDARAVARTVAGSNLVKSAVHGADPNWGRIAAAAGRSGAQLDPARLSVCIGQERVFAGSPIDFDEAAASRALREEIVRLELDLGIGDGFGEAWGCDLSAEYVAINSDYTT